MKISKILYTAIGWTILIAISITFIISIIADVQFIWEIYNGWNYNLYLDLMTVIPANLLIICWLLAAHNQEIEWLRNMLKGRRFNDDALYYEEYVQQ